MKRLLLAVLAIVMLALPQFPAEAKSTDNDILIDISVNGQLIRSDAHAYISGGTTYAPIRMLSDALNVDKLSWDESSKTVSIRENGKNLSFTVGSAYATVNGKRVNTGAVTQQIGGRTYAPVRFLCEQLGGKVSWNQTYYIVQVTKSGITVPTTLRFYDYTEDEIFWLARIIEAESSGEPLRGKIAVGNVIMNRVDSRDFPNTIYGVIFDREHGVQFQPVLNGAIYNTPSSDSIIAAKRALVDDKMVGNSLYFLNPRTASNFWIVNNRRYYGTIANHDFYL